MNTQKLKRITVKADCYRQFDADYNLNVPGEGYGGWHQVDIDLDLNSTAIVVMHAWSIGSREEYPGWYKAVEHIQRSQEILSAVFPPLLSAARCSDVKVFHVVGGGDYYKQYPGYRHTAELAEPETPLKKIPYDENLKYLHQIRAKESFPGLHNCADIEAGLKCIDFPPEARPKGDEGIAESASQLFALCKEHRISHLIYVGFAINWCLLMSPGGVLDMNRRGLICSVFRQAVTAVENKESARGEKYKEEGLWRTSLAFGFVFDVTSFLTALRSNIL
ncbi:MAG: hypothetical protein ACOX1Z_04775 [Candidatus Ratteibacteria bacterium]